MQQKSANQHSEKILVFKGFVRFTLNKVTFLLLFFFLTGLK